MSRTKKTTLPHYELLYIVSNKYTEQEVKPIAEKIEKLITDAKGEINYKEEWGKKKFAYPINHFNHGYYFLIEFDLAGVDLKEVDTEIKHMHEVLRHQIITKRKRSLEEIEDEKRILAKQAKRAEEKRAELESGAEKKPEAKVKKSAEVAKEAKKEEKEKVKPAEKEKSKEEVQLNLDKLDEKLDKILDTDDLL
ncbi:30S ribosomal protein S6 [Candidatus Parcubacteria bacterium]|nr:MAG: 30S ribosomal protein S6 [Candidatus Parcubacteria bacterium]